MRLVISEFSRGAHRSYGVVKHFLDYLSLLQLLFMPIFERKTLKHQVVNSTKLFSTG